MLIEGRRIDEGDLEWEEMIAEGGFGEVWRGIWRGQQVAIKRIKLDMEHQQPLAAVQQQEPAPQQETKSNERKDGSSVQARGLGRKFKSWGGNLTRRGKHHMRGSKSEGDGSRLLSDVDAAVFSNEGGVGATTTTGLYGGSSWVDQEILLLMRVKPHARIVLFHGAGKLKTTGEIFLVSEFMANGDLWDALAQRDPDTNEPKMRWAQRIQVAADIAEGMYFLHSRKPPLIHRDLKSQNVLLDRGGRAKIADFGLSRFAEVREQTAVARMSFATEHGDSMFATEAVMTGLQGSVLWMAPEIDTKESRAKYGLAVDVYSYAIVLMELITCRKPWEEVKWCHQIQQMVTSGERPKIYDNGKVYFCCIYTFSVEQCDDFRHDQPRVFFHFYFFIILTDMQLLSCVLFTRGEERDRKRRRSAAGPHAQVLAAESQASTKFWQSVPCAAADWERQGDVRAGS